MHALTAPLSELAEIEEICEERGREPGMLLLSGCVTSQKTHFDVCAWKKVMGIH